MTLAAAVLPASPTFVNGVFTGNVDLDSDAGLLRLGNAQDISAGRLAAASIRLGAVPSATPVSYTLTLGEASRPGTDANVAGGSATIRSGLGTGTGAASGHVFQTPALVGAGTDVQTYATRLTISTAGLTATVPYLAPDGTAAAPSIAGSGYATTGLYWAAGPTLGLSNGGTARWIVNSAGHFLAFADNTYDIGASGATRPRDLFLGRNQLIAGTLGVTGVATFSALVQTILSATGGAGLNLPHGAAPTSPVNGDVWTTTVGLFVRIDGVTKTVLFL